MGGAPILEAGAPRMPGGGAGGGAGAGGGGGGGRGPPPGGGGGGGGGGPRVMVVGAELGVGEVTPPPPGVLLRDCLRLPQASPRCEWQHSLDWTLGERRSRVASCRDSSSVARCTRVSAVSHTMSLTASFGSIRNRCCRMLRNGISCGVSLTCTRSEYSVLVLPVNEDRGVVRGQD